MTDRPEAPPPRSEPTWLPWHTFSLIVLTLAVAPAGLLLPALPAWGVTLVLLAAILAVAGRGVTGLWYGVLIDDRNMVSLSRLQMTLWTLLVLAGILAAGLHNVAAGGAENALNIDIPSELWLLMGISTASLVASPLIRSTKRDHQPAPQERERTLALLSAQRDAAVRVATRGLELVNLQPEDSRWSDLYRGEEVGNAAQVDLGKVQNLFFTLILVLVYGAALGSMLGDGGQIGAFPALDEGMITLLGISHAGYLTLKAVPQTQRA